MTDAPGQSQYHDGSSPDQIQPWVGAIVHYVSRGSADGKFPATCRAAIVTEPPEHNRPALVSLAVLNPTGLFFDEGIPYDDGKGGAASPDCTEPHEAGPFVFCGACTWTEARFLGGTWHWPEVD